MVLVRLLTRTKWRLVLLVGIISIAGFGAGLTLPALEPAGPMIQKWSPPEAFKSGGELSLPILREIAKTLERIDSRLQTIEKVVLGAANNEQTSQPESPNRRR